MITLKRFLLALTVSATGGLQAEASYQSLAARLALKSLSAVLANTAKHATENPALPLSKESSVDVTHIIFNAAVEDELPVPKELEKERAVLEAFVPLLADHFSKQNASDEYYGQKISKKNAAELAVRILQKASLKEFFTSNRSDAEKKALKVVDFGLACIDAKELGEAAKVPNWKQAFKLSKGIAHVLTNAVMDNIIQKYVDDLKLTSKNRQNALLDMLFLIVEPICQIAVESVVTI